MENLLHHLGEPLTESGVPLGLPKEIAEQLDSPLLGQWVGGPDDGSPDDGRGEVGIRVHGICQARIVELFRICLGILTKY